MITECPCCGFKEYEIPQSGEDDAVLACPICKITRCSRIERIINDWGHGGNMQIINIGLGNYLVSPATAFGGYPAIIVQSSDTTGKVGDVAEDQTTHKDAIALVFFNKKGIDVLLETIEDAVKIGNQFKEDK